MYHRLGVSLPTGSIDTERCDESGELGTRWGTVGGILALVELHSPLVNLGRALAALDPCADQPDRGEGAVRLTGGTGEIDQLGRLPRRRASIQPGRIWSYMFKTNRPRGTNNWVGVELTSGGRVFGFVDRYSIGLGTDEGELLVVGPDLTLVRPPREDADAQPEQLSLDGKWDGIHIRASEISSVRLHYEPKEPPSLRRRAAAASREGDTRSGVTACPSGSAIRLPQNAGSPSRRCRSPSR